MEDWLKIIFQGHETRNLDYKGPIKWDEKKDCCELVKDILAMANTNGGFIVIGVGEKSGVFKYIGLNQDQLKSYETTKLNQFLQNYADPPINVSVVKHKSQGKDFVIISVPVFSDTPHICQKDFPYVLKSATIYVRTANNESAPIKASADFRNIIEISVRNRSDLLLKSIRSIIEYDKLKVNDHEESDPYEEDIKSIDEDCNSKNPHQDQNYGYLKVIIHPIIKKIDRFKLSALKSMAKNAYEDYRGWPFIFIHENRPDILSIGNNSISSTISEPFFERNTFHYWQILQSGLLYKCELLLEDSNDLKTDNSRVLSIKGFAMSAAETIRGLIKFYENMIDDNERLTLRLLIIGSKNRKLSYLSPSASDEPYNCLCDYEPIQYSKTLPYIEWRAGLEDYAVELCEYIFNRFNWMQPNLIMTREVIRKLLNRDPTLWND